jgi:hypothetical protein
LPRGTPSIGAAVAQEQTEPGSKKKSLLPIPAGGGGNISEAKFWPYVESLTPEDWSHAFGYLYRDWPLIDVFLPYPDEKTARKAGVVKYQERFSEAFTRDTILHRFGSGKYHVDLNDTNKPHDATVCTVFLTIEDSRFPPLVDPATVKDHPENRSFVAQLRREGKLPPEGGAMSPQTNDSATAQALASVLQQAIRAIAEKKPEGLEGQMVPQLIGMMKTASDKAIEMAVGQVRQDSPEGVLKLIAAIKELMTQGNSNDKMFEMFLKMQADHQRLATEMQSKNTELLMKLIDQKTAPRDGTEGSLVKKVLEVSIDRLLDGSGGSAGGGDSWQQAVPNILHEVNNALGQLLPLFLRRGNPQAPMMPMQPNQPAPPSAEIPAGLPPGIDPNSPMMQMIEALTPTLAAQLRDPNFTGAHFADWFVNGIPGVAPPACGGFGNMTYQQVLAVGKENLLGLLKGLPVVWNQIAPAGEERINEFLDEFFMWDGSDPDGDEPPEDPAPQPHYSAPGPTPAARRKQKEKTQ